MCETKRWWKVIVHICLTSCIIWCIKEQKWCGNMLQSSSFASSCTTNNQNQWKQPKHSLIHMTQDRRLTAGSWTFELLIHKLQTKPIESLICDRVCNPSANQQSVLPVDLRKVICHSCKWLTHHFLWLWVRDVSVRLIVTQSYVIW